MHPLLLLACCPHCWHCQHGHSLPKEHRPCRGSSRCHGGRCRRCHRCHRCRRCRRWFFFFGWVKTPIETTCATRVQTSGPTCRPSPTRPCRLFWNRFEIHGCGKTWPLGGAVPHDHGPPVEWHAHPRCRGRCRGHCHRGCTVAAVVVGLLELVVGMMFFWSCPRSMFRWIDSNRFGGRSMPFV